jgi:sigma-B regulation protein RsbU (phosphoserine phosphatase)
MLPARQVGGDFYDVFPLDQDRIGVAIGDVADKGVPAALFMARVHALIMAEADTGLDTAEVLRLVNRHVTRLHKSTQFVTALYGILDLQTAEFRFSRAGHEPPLLLQPNGRVESLPYGPGMALGLWEDVSLDDRIVKLVPGQCLLIYSDGLTDCRSPRGEAFGLERVKHRLGTLAGRPAQEVCDCLLQSLREFQDGSIQVDDVTLVAVHIPRG